MKGIPPAKKGPGGASKSPIVILALLLPMLALAIVGLIAGSNPRKIAEPLRVPKRLFVAVIDASDSTEMARIRKSLDKSIDETSSCLTEADDFVLISLASTSAEIYSGQAPDQATLKKIIASVNPDSKGGSDYTGAYQLVAGAIERTRAKQAVVLIAGDGGRDGLNAHIAEVDQANKAAAQRISKNAKVSQVRFFGVSSNPKHQARKDIRWAFEGLDDQTLRILRSDERPWPEAW